MMPIKKQVEKYTADWNNPSDTNKKIVVVHHYNI
jgi:hypothetical protein